MSWDLSDGEIHFLWWFIQGSIMNPETRRRLRQAWGFCQRHACGFVAVECAFRQGWLHGSALLYEDLLGRARDVLNGPVLVKPLIAYRLRERRSCMLCELGVGPQSVGYASADILARGRDVSTLQAFARETRGDWEARVCDRCLGHASGTRWCRPHLVAAIRQGDPIDLDAERASVQTDFVHLQRYARSFRWEHRGTETIADRAALIAAIGWCSGWTEWLRLVDGPANAASDQTTPRSRSSPFPG